MLQPALSVDGILRMRNYLALSPVALRHFNILGAPLGDGAQDPHWPQGHQSESPYKHSASPFDFPIDQQVVPLRQDA